MLQSREHGRGLTHDKVHFFYGRIDIVEALNANPQVGMVYADGDLNCDGISDFGVYIPRPGGGRWIIRLNNGNNRFGINIDIGSSDLGGYAETPIIGNFNN